jgi:hypothetical protein
MATATLVNNDIDIGRRIIAALTRAGIPVTVYLWAFIPQLQEWQFMIATPLVDTKGPLAAYTEVNRVLQKAGVFDEVPIRRVFLRSPSDKVLKSLERESRAVPQEAFKVVNDQIAGNFVEDAYVYTGSLDILQSETARKNAQHQYIVIYMPYSGGGAAPTLRLEGIEGLRDFLEHKVSIRRDVLERTVREIDREGSATIPNVQLKRSELRRLGLA